MSNSTSYSTMLFPYTLPFLKHPHTIIESSCKQGFGYEFIFKIIITSDNKHSLEVGIQRDIVLISCID